MSGSHIKVVVNDAGCTSQTADERLSLHRMFEMDWGGREKQILTAQFPQTRWPGVHESRCSYSRRS